MLVNPTGVHSFVIQLSSLFRWKHLNETRSQFMSLAAFCRDASNWWCWFIS